LANAIARSDIRRTASVPSLRRHCYSPSRAGAAVKDIVGFAAEA
jgi:hypothetical protein